MQITIKKRENLTPNDKILPIAAKFFIEKLFTANVHEDKKLTISLCIMDKHHGEAWMQSTTNAYIRINKDDPFLMQITTLAHELIHIKQDIINGSHKSRSGKSWLWKGRYYPQDAPTRRCPWEQEAYSMESMLSIAFMQEYYLKEHIDNVGDLF